MNNVIGKIEEIIRTEFSELVDKMEKDFKKNYKKKVHNFLLSGFDSRMIANMVFVSSFESKSGNAIQKCARKIAELKFGEENVPIVVNPNNLSVGKIKVTCEEQFIVSNVDFDSDKVQAEIQRFISSHERKEKKDNEEKNNRELITQENIKELLELSKQSISSDVKAKPVDLAFFDGEKWNIIEIKMGGDLDSSNARGNVQKMLTLYVALNREDAKLYFATIYHKTGEKNTWGGTIKKYLSYPDMFLIGSEFWEKILPCGITFSKLQESYEKIIKDIKLEERLEELIKKTISEKGSD